MLHSDVCNNNSLQETMPLVCLYEGVSKGSWNHPETKLARLFILICDPKDIFTKSLCKVTHFSHYILTVHRPKLLHGCMILKFIIRSLFMKWTSTPGNVLWVHFIEQFSLETNNHEHKLLNIICQCRFIKVGTFDQY